MNPSDRLSRGVIITFYSFKGGSGRSMALANYACYLAQRSKRVLVIDWDLEAPGLHRYFRKAGDFAPGQGPKGVIEYFVDLLKALGEDKGLYSRLTGQKAWMPSTALFHLRIT